MQFPKLLRRIYTLTIEKAEQYLIFNVNLIKGAKSADMENLTSDVSWPRLVDARTQISN